MNKLNFNFYSGITLFPLLIGEFKIITSRESRGPSDSLEIIMRLQQSRYEDSGSSFIKEVADLVCVVSSVTSKGVTDLVCLVTSVPS